MSTEATSPDAFEKLKRLVEIRYKLFSVYTRKLQRGALMLRWVSATLKLLVIIFGLTVAARSGIEQFLQKYELTAFYQIHPMVLELAFAFLGFAIALMAALEQVFDYQERARKIDLLADTVNLNGMEQMRKKELAHTVEEFNRLIPEMERELKTLRDSAVNLRIQLPPFSH